MPRPGRGEKPDKEREAQEEGAGPRDAAAAGAPEPAESATAKFGAQGKPFERHSPFYIGFFGGIGALLAFWLGSQVLAIGSTLVLIVVALFLAAGLNPAVEWFQGHGLKRSWAVLAVITIVVVALTGFIMTIVPVISDQVAQITQNAPGWLDDLQKNKQVQSLDDKYDIIARAKERVEQGDLVSSLFGGALGIGLKVVSTLLNGFVVVVLMLYFLAGLDATKHALFRLAPASRRDRVTKLGDRIIKSVGGYVSGAFIVALCAGLTSLLFLFIVGLGKYAVALAFVVALLDVIPMIGATIGAVVVTAIGFATDPKIGIACLIFYIIYQQLENYVIYPRVMAQAVDIPGSVTVIAALIGAGLLGVVGALLAIPTAAAMLMLTREIFIRRQDAR